MELVVVVQTYLSPLLLLVLEEELKVFVGLAEVLVLLFEKEVGVVVVAGDV